MGATKAEGAFNKKRKEASFSKDDSSGTSRQQQKEMKKARQAARPHGDVVLQAKQTWDKLREKKLPAAKREQMVQETLSSFEGKLFDLASKHDGSRIVQSLMQYGTAKQRTAMITELQAHVVDLSKVQFGHFLITKMIKYGSKEDRALMAKKFTGHVVKLGTNAFAAEVIETAFDTFKPALVSSLRLEFYGKEFVFFKLESMKNMEDVLKHDVSKKDAIMTHVAGVLNRMADKQLMGLAFVQRLLWEYLSNASFEQLTSMLPTLRDAAVILLSTRYGALSVAKCIAMGTPKDRKRIVRSLKSKVLEACNHPSGYLVLLQLMAVVDDTVMVHKSILSELLPSLASIARHEKGHKVLLYLLNPTNKRYVDVRERDMLEPPMVPGEDGTLTLNYKKSPEVRREELLRGLQAPLESMVEANLAELICCRWGSLVVIETLRVWKSDKIITALLNLIEASMNSMDENALHMHTVGHFTLQTCIQLDLESFTLPLCTLVMPHLVSWCSEKRSAHIVLTLLKNTLSAPLVKEELRKTRDTLNSVVPSIMELLL